MINYEILGKVTAREGTREAKLTPKSQLMLARLVVERGGPVSRSELKRALELKEKSDPGARIKGIAGELRGQLRSALSIDDPQACGDGDGSYQMTLVPKQAEADVLRFRAGLTRARGGSGPEHARLLRQALAEWPGAAGLHGGYPLSGLSGEWADNTRRTLRMEYRRAVLECIKHDMSEDRYEKVMRECDQIVADSIATDSGAALGDDEFVGKWMHATYLSGDQAQAMQNFRQAIEYMKSLKRKPTQELRDLEWRIRNKHPRLGRPVSPPDRAVVTVPEDRNVPAVVPAPAAPTYLLRPASGDMDMVSGVTVSGNIPSGVMVSDERTAMSESGDVSISIAGNARVGSAIGRNEGEVTIHMGPCTEPSGDPRDEAEQDSKDREEER